MRRLTLILYALSLTIASAQEIADPRELFSEGQYFYSRDDYKEALYYFKKLTDSERDNAHFNYKVGECYLNIPGQEHLAVPYLEKAVQQLVPKNAYRSKSFEEKSAPLHALYYLGNAYRIAGNLEAALESYYTFIESPDFEGNYNINIAKAEIKSCERAKIIQDSPIEMEKKLLSEKVNTSFSEFNPVISGNGMKMVFVREQKFYDAILVSTLENGSWTEPLNINFDIGSDGDFYPTGMNSDGTAILFTREVKGNSNIYISKFDGVMWQKALEIPGKINTLANETFASFGEDDNVIYVVSNKQGGKGGYDIWISENDSSKGWSRPKNLGKTINTENDEATPYFCKAGNMLFFSSKGHYNMGGYDIFYSQKLEDKWDMPKNVGYPLNSTRDDLFFTIKPDCTTGFYSIIDEDTGFSNIYLIELHSIPMNSE